MTIFELNDCNVLNIYNTFTDGYYDEDYYGCPTCGGADVPDAFELTIVTDRFENKEISFYDEAAENAVQNFLPWVLENKDNFKDITLNEFINEKLPEICEETTHE